MERAWIVRRFVPAIGVALVAGRAAYMGPARGGQRPLLELVRDYPLPGNATRWDYVSVDPAHSQLLLAHLGDSAVVVVDTRSKAIVGRIRNVGQVHGVLAVPGRGRIYATATGTNELVTIDGQNLAIVARTPVGRYPDGLAYAATVGKLYVSNKEGGSVSVVDVHKGKLVATIAMGGTVGNVQYDPATEHVIVNAEGRRELVEIDPTSDKIIARTRLPKAEGNHGLLIEPARRMAFIACEGNDRLLVVNLRDRRVTATFDVAGEPDVLAYDPGLGLLYVATESGPVHLFSAGAKGVARLGSVPVGPNAHTVAVDTTTHEVFFPLNVGGRPVLRVMRPAGVNIAAPDANVINRTP